MCLFLFTQQFASHIDEIKEMLTNNCISTQQVNIGIVIAHQAKIGDLVV